TGQEEGVRDGRHGRCTDDLSDSSVRRRAGVGASDHVQNTVAAFTDRYVARGRCPADDLPDPAPWQQAAGPQHGRSPRR
ncbi:ergothioneine biosynthesis glutamate--cysteine ligase EgtA, partial [Streptomyces clavifer]